jgi:hypothetical protein
MRILLTAGFDRAPNVLALAELLSRDRHQVAGILVVSPYSLTRLRRMVRLHGRAVVLRSLRRLVGKKRTSDEPDAVDLFFEEEGIVFDSLRQWCLVHRVPHHVVMSLNSRDSVSIVAQAQPDVVIYGGGGILRTPFLDAAGRRVLNAHSGPLPAIRGMNPCEWSLLLGAPPAVTIHFIDEGITTGKVIETIPLGIDAGDTVESLRAKCTVLGIQGLRRSVATLRQPGVFQEETPDLSRQCFVMAPVLRDLLEWKLAHTKKRQKRAA